MIGCKEKKKKLRSCEGEEVVELECVFIVSVKNRILSLDET
jgi:hypothetical protein